MSSAETYKTIVITSIKEETNGVKTFSLVYEDDSAIPYLAGQFLTLVFCHHGKEERRSYSFSSSPAQNEQLAITVKRVDNGAYSRLLVDRAVVGNKLYTTGAAGLFTLNNHAPYEQVFFFAAGIGITPIISLIRTILLTEQDKKVVLVYSNRTKEEVVFYDALMDLVNQYSNNFKIEFLYSTSFNLARARLSKSLVPVLLQESAATPKGNMLFYICGPFAYMRMVIFALEEYGISEAQIRKENFNTNDRQVVQIVPPDTDPHLVTIKINGEENTFPVQYPETILQAAKKHGLSLPYSCEVGRCGSCASICTKGKVWLSYNEVLMDMDLKHGSILTCTGHPIEGDVTIEV